MPGKTRKYSAVVGPFHFRPPQHNDVEARQFLCVLAERLPHQALQAVPVARLSAMFPGYRQPQPGQVHAVIPGQDRKQLVATPAGLGEHMAERVCVG
jgi:hypothetical protein